MWQTVRWVPWRRAAGVHAVTLDEPPQLAHSQASWSSLRWRVDCDYVRRPEPSGPRVSARCSASASVFSLPSPYSAVGPLVGSSTCVPFSVSSLPRAGKFVVCEVFGEENVAHWWFAKNGGQNGTGHRVL